VTFFISFRLQYTLQAGWPDWANFRLLGDCLLWVVFVKIAEIAQLIGQLFYTVKVVHYFLQKVVWATFWATFWATNSSGHPV
jgi:hypothetical protein